MIYLFTIPNWFRGYVCQSQLIIVGVGWREQTHRFLGLVDPNASVLKGGLSPIVFDKSTAPSNLISLGVEILLGILWVIQEPHDDRTNRNRQLV